MVAVTYRVCDLTSIALQVSLLEPNNSKSQINAFLP